MSSQGNGQRYQITFSGFLAQEMKRLHSLAKEAGMGEAFVEALEQAVFRMQHDPWGFGELTRRVKKPPLSVHVRTIRPLIIEFAIHEEKPIVLIKRVGLLT